MLFLLRNEKNWNVLFLFQKNKIKKIENESFYCLVFKSQFLFSPQQFIRLTDLQNWNDQRNENVST